MVSDKDSQLWSCNWSSLLIWITLYFFEAWLTISCANNGGISLAQEYLEFLYTPQAQNIIAKNYYRPARTDLVTKENLKQFPKLELVTIDETFGGWNQAQKKHFSDGGIFDEIQK